jgi:formylmethanofuran dehydrogenase subunit E-like metal-binding protein
MGAPLLRKGTELFLKQLHLTLTQNAAKRAVFFKGSWDEFQKQVGKDPEFSDVIKYICSRCGVVVCLNRHAPFYNKKLFKKLTKDPDSVIMG